MCFEIEFLFNLFKEKIYLDTRAWMHMEEYAWGSELILEDCVALQDEKLTG